MKTKKSFLLTIFVVTFLSAIVTEVNAQRVEISPLIGYETGAMVHTNLGTLHIGDGMNFGGSLDFGLGGGRYAELSYTHMKSYLSVDEVLNVRRICDLAVDYYSVGILQEVKPDAKVSPYGLFTVGLVNYRPTTGDISSENKMDVSLAGGIKIHATEKIGLRLQARLLMPIYYAGTYFTVGSGGAGYGISGGVVAVQGDFTAALVFAF
jgi:hypothetical protein